MKRWFTGKLLFNVFIYLSLLFLFIYLYRLDYFSFQDVSFNPVTLVISTVFLWAGYFFSTVSWWYILRKHQIKITLKHAVVSHGLSIFAKYIPGKIWVILGRAGYVANMKHSLKTTSFLSLKEQLIYVWEGLLISTIPMLFIYGPTLFTISVFVLCFLLTLFLYSKWVHFWVLGLINKIIRKEIELPYLKFTENLSIIFYVLIYWIMWLFGFYFFVISFYPEANFGVAFAFPLSIVIGLMAIIFPGGLGVREGIMGGYMVLIGIPLKISSVITVYARLWFISGEVFIFLLALSLKTFIKKD